MLELNYIYSFEGFLFLEILELVLSSGMNLNIENDCCGHSDLNFTRAGSAGSVVVPLSTILFQYTLQVLQLAYNTVLRDDKYYEKCISGL